MKNSLKSKDASTATSSSTWRQQHLHRRRRGDRQRMASLAAMAEHRLRRDTDGCAKLLYCVVGVAEHHDGHGHGGEV